jgi:hypothetical protein
MHAKIFTGAQPLMLIRASNATEVASMATAKKPIPVILLDRSGSMGDATFSVMRSCETALRGAGYTGDTRVFLVTFDSYAELHVSYSDSDKRSPTVNELPHVDVGARGTTYMSGYATAHIVFVGVCYPSLTSIPSQGATHLGEPVRLFRSGSRRQPYRHL